MQDAYLQFGRYYDGLEALWARRMAIVSRSGLCRHVRGAAVDRCAVVRVQRVAGYI